MNKYLEKVALTRLVKEIARGSVSATPASLLERGMLRSPSTYSRGARVANDKLQAKLGVNVNKAGKKGMTSIVAPQAGGYASIPRKGENPNIIFGKSSPLVQDINIGAANREHSRALREMQHQAGISHELFEADAIKRRSMQEPVKDRHSRSLVNYEATSRYLPLAGFSAKDTYHVLRGVKDMDAPRLGAELYHSNYGKVGGHMSLDVLGRESNLIRSNPYMAKSNLATFRAQSGEADYLHKITGKKYGVDRFYGKDLKKLDLAKPDNIGPNANMYQVG